MHAPYSSGESARPIDAAGTALKFDIVIYLVGKATSQLGGQGLLGGPVRSVSI